MRLLPIAVAAALLGAGGCGGDPPAPPPGDVAVTLGGAAPDGSGFLALEGDVSLIPGAQGGFHVWMKYRVTGLPAQTVRLSYTVRRVSDGRLILKAARQQAVGAPGAGGYWEPPSAIPAFMCPSPIGVQVQDQPLQFQLDVDDLDGVPLGSAGAMVTPHCPDGDQSAFCVRICNG